MYRAPEMVDLYNNYPIDERTDVWVSPPLLLTSSHFISLIQALGCLLYKLCYTIHPFEDSSKLSIINANYKIPENDASYSMFHPLMRMSVCYCVMSLYCTTSYSKLLCYLCKNLQLVKLKLHNPDICMPSSTAQKLFKILKTTNTMLLAVEFWFK